MVKWRIKYEHFGDPLSCYVVGKRHGDSRAEWWTGALLGSKFEQAWYSTVSMSSALNFYLIAAKLCLFVFLPK